ncbi:melatonin receptor type 1B-A-like [Lytechinus variegatus]|uniref:melatonin receptor type 1B-A-like n=1 Tax=Lytechinus variegatus TaxID=7654 RepID=UPI001BB1D6D8|nr:melatonin receptor type 1B-A-like [Lytechinus variegatus]
MDSSTPSEETVLLNTTPASNGTDWEFTDYKQRVFIGILFILISAVGLVGNLMVIVAVSLSRKLQTATNAFVLNTSCVDFLNCLFLPFNAVSMLSKSGWPLAPGVCTIAGGITMVCLGATLVNLALIAINRAYLIVNPRDNYCKLYSPVKLGLMVFFAWFYPIMAFALPPSLGIGKLGYSEAYKVCFWDDDHELVYINDYIVALTFLISFIIIIVCYAMIYVHVRRHNRRLQVFYSNNPTKPSDAASTRELMNGSSVKITEKCHNSTLETQAKKSRNKREIHITKNLFYVVCAFFFCILPYPISLTIPFKSVADVYAGVLLMANSCVNPLIYSFKHPHFNIIFRMMCRGNWDEIPQPSTLLKFVLRSSGIERQRSSSNLRTNETGSTR